MNTIIIVLVTLISVLGAGSNSDIMAYYNDHYGFQSDEYSIEYQKHKKKDLWRAKFIQAKECTQPHNTLRAALVEVILQFLSEEEKAETVNYIANNQYRNALKKKTKTSSIRPLELLNDIAKQNNLLVIWKQPDHHQLTIIFPWGEETWQEHKSLPLKTAKHLLALKSMQILVSLDARAASFSLESDGMKKNPILRLLPSYVRGTKLPFSEMHHMEFKGSMDLHRQYLTLKKSIAKNLRKVAAAFLNTPHSMIQKYQEYTILFGITDDSIVEGYPLTISEKDQSLQLANQALDLIVPQHFRRDLDWVLVEDKMEIETCYLLKVVIQPTKARQAIVFREYKDQKQVPVRENAMVVYKEL